MLLVRAIVLPPMMYVWHSGDNILPMDCYLTGWHYHTISLLCGEREVVEVI